jgi:hypothetical protein
MCRPDKGAAIDVENIEVSRHTDGPLPESREFLAGYGMVDVVSPERALEIAATASAAPGPGGVPLKHEIDVRAMLGLLSV